MNDHQKFAAKLNAALDERGWNQSELARRAGVRRDAVSTYCRGIAIPSPALGNKIAKALGWAAEPRSVAKKAKSVAKKSPAPTDGVEIRQVDTGGIRLSIDREVTLEQAMQILTILRTTGT